MQRWWKAPASVLLVASMVLASFPAARAAAAAGAQPAPARIAAPDDSSIALPSTGQVIVKFRRPEAAASVMAVAAKGGQSKAQANPTRMVVRLPQAPAQARAMIKALQALPGVVYVENDERMKALEVPNDPKFNDVWGLSRIKADQAWAAVGNNQATVTVAVVDTGVDAQHEDLAGNVLAGYNAITQTYDETPDVAGHGTHVAGTIAGVYNNGIGITGVAGPANIKILPVKVLGDDGSGSFSDVAAGIEWAADNGANVINLSLGGAYSQAVADAVRYAADRGVVVVAAAGNEHANTAQLAPAGVPGAVTVSAVDEYTEPAWFSNFGAEVELAAPGTNILSTVPGNGYDWKSGTSMATPHVAAVAALIKAAHPEYTRSEVQGCLVTSVEPFPAITAEYGAGLVRADLAVACDASELPSKADFKLESTNTKQPLRGFTTFTFDANPAHVASIEVTNQAGGQVLGTAPVTTGLTDVAVDLSAFLAGAVTLTASALDSNGVTVASVTGTYRVAGPSYVIQMRDEQGDPAPGAQVALYVEYIDRWYGGMDPYWEYAGDLTTDGNGRIALSNATIPEGHRVMVMAWTSDATGHPILRYGTLAAPGLLDLNEPLVRTTFDASAVPTTDREFMLLPDGEGYNPLWLWPYGSVMDAWLPEGGYSVVFDSQADGYFLPQHADVTATSSTLTFDLTNTATVSWQPTAGRTYSHAQVSLFAEGMHWGIGYEVTDLGTGRSMTVKQGNYHAYTDISLLDGDDREWSYEFSMQSLTVPAAGVIVKEGTPTQSLHYSAPTVAMPGNTWNASFWYPLMEGGFLYGVYGPTTAGVAAAKLQSNQIPVAQERDGRAPRRTTVNASAKSPVLTKAENAHALELIDATMVIVDADGNTVSRPEDIATYSTGGTWRVPAMFPDGAYQAEVALDAGPLGEIEGEIDFNVGKDTVATGLLVKVTDADGNALPNAEASLLQPVYYSNGHTKWMSVNYRLTDADGFARLDGSGLRTGLPVKLSVEYWDPVNEGIYAIVKDVTLPQTLTVSLGETHPVTVKPTDESGSPMADATVGFAYVDENGDSILMDYGTQTDTGEATFHLGAGTMRFTATDQVNLTFTLGDVTTVTNSTLVVDLPVGDLGGLALDPAAQFADGSPMIPLIAYAEPNGFPGILPLAFFGEYTPWRVTPGVYIHTGEYLRPWENQTWLYDLTGGEVVLAFSNSVIPVGGGFSAQIDKPWKAGSNTYYFPVRFTDSHYNTLFGLYSEEEAGILSVRKASLSTALKNGDLKALRQDPAFARLQKGSRMANTAPELLRTPGVTAQYEPEISPILTVQNGQGAEVWRDTYWLNWYQATYYAPSGAGGTYTARIALGVGPEGDVAAETTFDVSTMGLSVSPTVFNPTAGKLTVTLQLPTQDTYSVTIQNEQGVTVKTLATNKSGSGKVDLLWDGKNDSGKLVPNGIYRAVATTVKSGSSSASFKLRVPPTATQPKVSAEKPFVNKTVVTLTGTATPGFTLAAQVKGPGQTEWTRLTGLGIADVSDGHFSITIPLTPDDGTYQIQVQGVDPEDGRTSPWSATVTVVRDTVAPDLNITSPVIGQAGILVNNTKLTLIGTTEAKATVKATATAEGTAPVTKSVTADSKGNWKIDGLPVANGGTVTLTVTDLAGNETENAFGVTVDMEKPSVVTADDQKPAISLWLFQAEEGTEVRPVVDKSGLTYAVSGSNADTFALTVRASEPLGSVKVSPAVKGLEPEITGDSFTLEIMPNKNGSTTYSIEIYDRAGNKTILPKVYVKLDSTGPTLTINKPAGTNLLATNGETEATVELLGTANETLTAVKVVNGLDQSELPAAVTVSGKSFTAKVSLPLTEAQYQLRVVGYDLAGNVSQPGSKDFRMVKVDVTAPEVPALTEPVAYDGNLYVTANTAALKGTAEPGVTVYAQVAGSTAPVKAVAKADGSFSLSAKFTGNTADLKLWAVDAAGNASDEALFTLNYDKTATTVSDLVLMVGGLEYPLTVDAKGKWSYADGTINVGDAESVGLIGVAAEPVGSVQVNGKAAQTEIGGENFGVVLSPVVKGGANSLTLKVMDRAGNATSVSVSFTLDAPKATIAEKDVVTKTGGGTYTFNITYSEAMQRVQVIPTLIDGDADALQITSQAPVNAPTYDSPTKWKVVVTLPETGTGNWTLQFLGTDRQGNTTVIGSAGQDIRRITLDTSAPAIAMTGTWEPVMLTSMATFPVQGQVTDLGAGLKSLTVNGSTVPVDSQGNFLKEVPVKEGVTKIEVKATDLVGNVTTTTTQLVRKSKISTLKVSKSGPTAGLLTISGSTDKPVLVADGTAATSVELAIVIKDKDGTVVMTLDPVTAGADGKYTVAPVNVSSLPKGTYTIAVTATVPDFNGVTKTAMTTFTVN